MGSYASSYNEGKDMGIAFEGDSVRCMQICTHPFFGRLVIVVFRRHNRGYNNRCFRGQKEIPDKRHDPQTALSDETSARPRRARR
jgi:hypothetical protein